ncbi:hypothetical protein XarjCFBP7645_12050 [Xanthomonas arboricola]|uniref:Uncharacterized protein n=1 Tax=Xanthomonas arboricola TaxID=56448 RepID=A0A2S7AET9_9XANT|nr:hypothetical protein XarjCFBP7645_12050 [Xanthomonas arboricola]
MHTDHLDWSLSAHRRGTLSGMDAAPEPTWTYLRRVPRWWADKGPAATHCVEGGQARALQPSHRTSDAGPMATKALSAALK